MSIKKQFLLIVSFALVFTAYSQGGCLEYKSRLFVINIVNNGQPVKDSQLKLFLVNEDSLPYWNEPPNINNNTDGYTPRILRLNTMLNSRNLKNPYERQTFYPKLKETWYTCKIPTYSPDQSEKLYQVLIVNKKTKDSIYTYLPYAKSIEICANNLDNTREGDIKFDDGSVFEPITIDIAVRKTIPLPQYPLINLYVKFDYTKKWNAEAGDTLLYVYQARIHDKNTLAVIQKIPIEYALPFPSNYFKQNIETGDFYKDNPEHVPDFRIMTAQVKNDKNQVLSTTFDHYVFDANQQKYVLDKVLSGSGNVVIQNNDPLIIKNEVSQINDIKYIDNYQLINGAWVLIERKTQYLTEPAPYKYQKECITWSENSFGMQPVFQMPYNDKHYTLTDSFALVNNCPEKIFLSLSHAYDKFTFSLPEKIKPNDTVYLKYTEWLLPQPGYIYLVEKNTYINFGDKSSEIKGFNYFVAAPGTEVRDKQTGLITQYVSKIDTFSNTGMVLEVYETGIPKSYGLLFYHNGKKVGRWSHWDETGNRLEATEHGKKLTATIGNPERLQSDVSIRVKNKTEWITVDFVRRENNFIFYIPLDADSLEIISGKSRVDARFTQWTSNYDGQFTYYLINSNEDYIDQMGIRYPITWYENEYMINWDVNFYGTSKSGTIETEVKRLQAKYPGVSFISFNNYAHLIKVSIHTTSETKKQQLLSNLINETSISSLSQGVSYLSRPETMYVATTATIIVSPYLRIEEVKAIGDKYNAKLTNIWGSGNYYELDLKQTLYDKTYYALLQKIQKEPNVISVSTSFVSDINYLDE
jgi:hypothetical protein